MFKHISLKQYDKYMEYIAYAALDKIKLMTALAKERKDKREQAAIQRQVLAPLPPRSSRIPGIPLDYYRAASDRKNNDDNGYNNTLRAQGVTRGGPEKNERRRSSAPDIKSIAAMHHYKNDIHYYGTETARPAERGTNNATENRKVDLMFVAHSKTGNKTADLFLEYNHCRDLIRKAKVDVESFLKEYMVEMVRADGVHAWACEQIKSQVLTPDVLIEQIQDIFGYEKDGYTGKRAVFKTWRDYRKYGERLEDFYGRIVSTKSKSWTLLDRNKLMFYLFRPWFVYDRMGGVIVNRAKLALQEYEFYKNAQKLDIVPNYDEIYSGGDVYTALKTLQEIQDKKSLADMRRKQKYGARPDGDYERKHNDDAGLYILFSKSLQSAAPYSGKRPDRHSGSGRTRPLINDKIFKDIQVERYGAGGAPRLGPDAERFIAKGRGTIRHGSDDMMKYKGYKADKTGVTGPKRGGANDMKRYKDDEAHKFKVTGTARCGSNDMKTYKDEAEEFKCKGTMRAKSNDMITCKEAEAEKIKNKDAIKRVQDDMTTYKANKTEIYEAKTITTTASPTGTGTYSAAEDDDDDDDYDDDDDNVIDIEEPTKRSPASETYSVTNRNGNDDGDAFKAKDKDEKIQGSAMLADGINDLNCGDLEYSDNDDEDDGCVGGMDTDMDVCSVATSFVKVLQ